ncbi:hypothetical protein KUCAC02_016988 [Chaenocephalus aceratus]|nr:hypothetical protein KUCAC02_016988 [Chaenocephalus aceratus]
MLEVTGPPEGTSRTESHHLLADLCKGGRLIQRNTARDAHLASSYSIFAMLPSRCSAPSGTLHHRTSTGHKVERCDSNSANS